MNAQKLPNGMKTTPDRETRKTQKRYDRIAGVYDQMEYWVEAARFQIWRAMLWRHVHGPRVLELGVGTGKNFTYYPPNLSITGIDLSSRMLERAKRHAKCDNIGVDLRIVDAQALPFADASFDTVVTTFVFCSVPDPVRGLQEARRVLVPGGQLLLLEHVLSRRPILRLLMRLANPFVVRLMGAHIDRAGFTIHQLDDLWGDVVKLIEAERPVEATA